MSCDSQRSQLARRWMVEGEHGGGTLLKLSCVDRSDAAGWSLVYVRRGHAFDVDVGTRDARSSHDGLKMRGETSEEETEARE